MVGGVPISLFPAACRTVEVRRNIDHLFQRPTPAALQRKADGNFVDGHKIGKMLINAGVVLLKPDEAGAQRPDQTKRRPDPKKRRLRAVAGDVYA